MRVLFRSHVGTNPTGHLPETPSSRSPRLVPRPFALDFNFKGKAEEGPDRDNARQYRNALQRRLDGDGVDDVGGQEELEPQQYRLAQIIAKAMHAPVAGSAGPAFRQEEARVGKGVVSRFRC